MNKIYVLRKFLVIADLNIKNSSHDPLVSTSTIRNMSKIQDYSLKSDPFVYSHFSCRLQLTSLPAYVIAIFYHFTVRDHMALIKLNKKIKLASRCIPHTAG